MRERGLSIAGIAPRFGLLFLQAVVFAVLCRPENSPVNLLHPGVFPIPLWFCELCRRHRRVRLAFVQTRKPIEPGFAWSAVAVFLWLQSLQSARCLTPMLPLLL